MPTHTTEVVDVTSLTVDELEALLPSFETAFLPYMAEWTFQGRRRQSRRYTTSQHCPLPTAADRLLFILVYLKQPTMPTLHGRVFGMRQSKAHHWMHVLLPVWRTTLRALGAAPCRRVEALRQRLGVEGPPFPLAPAVLEAAQAAPPTAPPLFVMTAPSDPFHAPPIRLNSNRALGACPRIIF
jgi:hypothetical protein